MTIVQSSTSPLPVEKVKAFTELALLAAFEAGKAILEIYAEKFAVELKGDGSPLTEADNASHRIIARSLSETGLPVLSEEGKEIPYSERMNWKNYWLVDPLDGTKEFVKRNGEFTVNIALMENGSPVSGIILQPVTGIAYVGWNSGLYKFSDISETTLNPVTRILPGKETEVLRVIASRSHRSDETEKFINDLATPERKTEIVQAGSSLKFCLLAEGKADIYPRFAPTMEWDTAAGHALLNAAGKNIYLYPAGTVMTYNKPVLLNDWFIAR